MIGRVAAWLAGGFLGGVVVAVVAFLAAVQAAEREQHAADRQAVADAYANGWSW